MCPQSCQEKKALKKEVIVGFRVGETQKVHLERWRKMWVEPLKLVLSKGSTASNFPRKPWTLGEMMGYHMVLWGKGEGKEKEKKEQSKKEETEKIPFDKRAQDMLSDFKGSGWRGLRRPKREESSSISGFRRLQRRWRFQFDDWKKVVIASFFFYG